MIEASLALQATIRARLIASADVLALVPTAHVIDRNSRPELFPCILIGEGQTLYADDYERFYETVFADVHVWVDEPGLAEAKAVAGAIRAALRRPPWSVQGHRCHAITVANSRFIRDPGGTYSHGIVTVEAVMQEAA